VATERRTKILT